MIDSPDIGRSVGLYRGCNDDESVSLRASITLTVIECPAITGTGGVTYLFEPGRGLMDSGRECCLRMIIAELIKGAITEKAISVTKDLARVSPCWRAGILSFGYGKAGKSVRLGDSSIATVTKRKIMIFNI